MLRKMTAIEERIIEEIKNIEDQIIISNTFINSEDFNKLAESDKFAYKCWGDGLLDLSIHLKKVINHSMKY
jgi:hypothetical protein